MSDTRDGEGRDTDFVGLIATETVDCKTFEDLKNYNKFLIDEGLFEIDGVVLNTRNKNLLEYFLQAIKDKKLTKLTSETVLPERFYSDYVHITISVNK